MYIVSRVKECKGTDSAIAIVKTELTQNYNDMKILEILMNILLIIIFDD